jgi:hypothetical protein
MRRLGTTGQFGPAGATSPRCRQHVSDPTSSAILDEKPTRPPHTSPLLVKLAVVGRCRGNGCPALQLRSCPVGCAGFGSPCPWPVAAIGRLLVVGCGLVGSSHHTILWSCACHTFPSPRPQALGASADHRGGCLVSGDVFIGGAPVPVSPRAAVRGVDRVEPDPTAVGLGAHPVAEHRSGQTGHRLAEAFTASASPCTVTVSQISDPDTPTLSRPRPSQLLTAHHCTPR